MKDYPSAENRYVQQHLANERTFLAWIRTSISIIGIGFLAAGLVFNSTYSETARFFSIITGIGALVIGSAVIVAAALEYRIKRKQINRNEFRSSYIIVSLIVILMLLVFGLLFFLMYFLLFA
ncbi:DUF202 domain-containing protein [Paenibacillus sp. M1]|uniref:DUF202 domain-containing protein n=1 Tax=Paenibacillus haidiansis TaxID=1574488 RepID=A0ABU7VLG7_9BACL